MYRKKIAVIGSGISGLSSCLFLSKKYDVYLFEKNNSLGGHTRTVNIKESAISYDIDTGFIVFNDNNYPDLVELFKYLDIETQNSNMSFSISIKKPEYEYGSNSIFSLFAQKKNIFSVKFWILLIEIIKLYNHCKKINLIEEFKNYTLENFLLKFNYSKNIRDLHIYPMISSIWSCNKDDVKKFPLISFINFFDNHKLFNFSNRQQWKFVKGGSKQYIESITKKKLFNYKINNSVKKIYRDINKAVIIFTNDEKFIADKLILATHADQALNLLDNPTNDEISILSKFRYSKNAAFLHSDNSFMPKRKSVWSSWNFQGNELNEKSFSLTYWMNSLQDIKSRKNFFVSINPSTIPQYIYDQTIFEHPILDLATLSAQKKIDLIQGKLNTWFCGSYCGYGFHEDGIQSAAYIANLLKINLPWKRSNNFINRLEYW